MSIKNIIIAYYFFIFIHKKIYERKLRKTERKGCQKMYDKIQYLDKEFKRKRCNFYI